MRAVSGFLPSGFALAALALLAGCAGVNRSMEYSGTKYVTLSDPALPHAFWVFDKPDEGRALINVAPGAAFVEGATFCLGANCGAEAKFLKAAELWFVRTGRICSVTSGALIVRPTNYEVAYTCMADPAPVMPATKPKVM